MGFLNFYWNQIYLLKSLLHLYISYVLFFERGGGLFLKESEKERNYLRNFKFYIYETGYFFFLELFLKERRERNQLFQLREKLDDMLFITNCILFFMIITTQCVFWNHYYIFFGEGLLLKENEKDMKEIICTIQTSWNHLTSILYVLFLELFLKEGEKGMKEIIYTRIQILLKPDTSLEIIITSIFFFFWIIFKRRKTWKKKKII